jgi:hypothetical protein
MMRVLRRDEEPTGWLGLEWLISIGGRVEISLPPVGGSGDAVDSLADLEAQLGTFTPPNYGTILEPDWSTLDRRMLHIESRAPLRPPVTFDWILAAYLRSKAPQGLAPYQTLAGLEKKFKISLARIAALQDLLRRHPPPHGSLPVWYDPKAWIDVRVNNLHIRDILPGTATPSQPGRLRAVLLHALQEAVPELALLRLSEADSAAWEEVEASLKIFSNSAQSEYWTACLLLPPGEAWRKHILTRVTPLTQSAYVTFSASNTFVEAPLAQCDALVLKRVFRSLGLAPWELCRVLAEAFQRAWDGAFVQFRLGTELRSEDGRSRFRNVDPESAEAELIVGTDLLTLLRVRRMSRLVSLAFGHGGERPVTIVVEAPRIPPRHLHELTRAAGPTALQLIVLPVSQTQFPGQHLVLGPFPAKWLENRCGALDRPRIRADLEESFTRLAVTEGVRLFFLAKPGQAPFGLYFLCRDSAASSAAILALHDEAYLGTLQERLGFRPAHFLSSNLPPECVELLGPEGLRKYSNPSAQGTAVPNR